VPKKTGVGYTKKNNNKIIDGPWKTANEIAKNLGLDNGDDLYSYETLVTAIKKNMSDQEQREIFTAFASNNTIQSLGVPPDTQQYNQEL
jgi:recombinational DNA repair protein (RecF pathway)